MVYGSSKTAAQRLLLGNLPWVLRATGYGPKLLNTVGSLQRQMVAESYTPFQETTPPLEAEEMGQQSKKN
jgi:hypothetical protein